MMNRKKAVMALALYQADLNSNSTSNLGFECQVPTTLMQTPDSLTFLKIEGCYFWQQIKVLNACTYDTQRSRRFVIALIMRRATSNKRSRRFDLEPERRNWSLNLEFARAVNIFTMHVHVYNLAGALLRFGLWKES